MRQGGMAPFWGERGVWMRLRPVLDTRTVRAWGIAISSSLSEPRTTTKLFLCDCLGMGWAWVVGKYLKSAAIIDAFVISKF